MRAKLAMSSLGKRIIALSGNRRILNKFGTIERVTTTHIAARMDVDKNVWRLEPHQYELDPDESVDSKERSKKEHATKVHAAIMTFMHANPERVVPLSEISQLTGFSVVDLRAMCFKLREDGLVCLRGKDHGAVKLVDRTPKEEKQKPQPKQVFGTFKFGRSPTMVGHSFDDLTRRTAGTIKAEETLAQRPLSPPGRRIQAPPPQDL